MLRILISAYACEPNKGSEPSVGWEWANRLPNHHKVTVITRANNRQAIEHELDRRATKHRATFIFHDLPKPLIWMKQMGILPVFMYYLLWQLSIRFKLNRKIRDFDIIHHVTFNGFRCPGAWWLTGVPVVLGPLGGGSITSSEFKRCYYNRWWKELIRSISIRTWRFNPWTLASLKSANVVLVVGDEMQKLLKHKSFTTKTMLETAVPAELEDTARFEGKKPKKHFLVVGNIEPWKGWQIAIASFADALSSNIDDDLIFIGKGSQRTDAARMAEDLGIANRVCFAGHLEREDLWNQISSAKALIFPSIRETSGNAALEAMALGCPVICFAHQGIGWITNDDCAIRIPPLSWPEAIRDFSKAITSVIDNQKFAAELGQKAREHVISNYLWQNKIDRICEIYIGITEHTNE